MSRAFVSQTTGAVVYVFSDDHCPPHVHLRHRGEGWIARVRFSFLNGTVSLMSIAPTQNIPLQRVVNGFLSEVQERLPDCRRLWWDIRQTSCLENQWAVVREAGNVEVCAPRTASAKQIAEAPYDPDGERVRVTFRNGTTEVVRLRP